MAKEGRPQSALPPEKPFPAAQGCGGKIMPMRRWAFIGGLARAIALVLGLAPLVAFPAVAQPAKGPAFYVVFNSLTKTCSVVDETPKTDTPNITVASDAIYPTRDEAEQAVKTLKACNQ